MGHQNNPPRILPRRYRAPGFEIPGSATGNPGQIITGKQRKYFLCNKQKDNVAISVEFLSNTQTEATIQSSSTLN